MEKKLSNSDITCIGDDSVLSVVSRVMMDHRLNQAMQEIAFLKGKIRWVQDVVKNVQDKMFDLVWYVRSDPDEPLEAKRREEVEKKYPLDMKNLMEDESRFTHGMNSGALGLCRILSAEEDVKHTNELFRKDHNEDQLSSSEEERGVGQDLTVEQLEQIETEFPSLHTSLLTPSKGS